MALMQVLAIIYISIFYDLQSCTIPIPEAPQQASQRLEPFHKLSSSRYKQLICCLVWKVAITPCLLQSSTIHPLMSDLPPVAWQ